MGENDDRLRTIYWNRIKGMLSRESNFSGFKRSIVMENEELVRCFGDLLD